MTEREQVISEPYLSEKRHPWDALLLALLCGAWAAMVTLTAERIPRLLSDDAYYLGLAQSIRIAGTYTFNGVPHVLYPPGLPLLLAFVEPLIGTGEQSFAFVMALAGAAAIAGSYFFILRRLGRVPAILCALLLATTPFFYELASRRIISDLPYFAASVWCLCFIDLLDDAQTSSTRFVRGCIASLLLSVVVLMRTASLALLVGLITYLVWSLLRPRAVRLRNRSNLLAPVCIGFGLFGLWIAWTIVQRSAQYPGHHMQSYVSQIRFRVPQQPELGLAGPAELFTRFAKNVSLQFGHWGELFLHIPWIDSRWYSPFVLLLGLLVLVGLIDRLRSKADVFEWYALAYLGMYALWPFDEGARFILPLYPLLFYYSWIGARLLLGEGQMLSRRKLKALSVLTAVVAAMAFLSAAETPESNGIQSQLSVAFWLVLAPLLFALSLVPPKLKTSGHKLMRSLVPIVFIAAVFSGVRGEYALAKDNLSPQPETFRHEALMRASSWLEVNSQKGDVFSTEQHAILHFLTSHTVIPFLVSSDPLKLLALFQEEDVDYLVVQEHEEGFEYYSPTPQERVSQIRMRCPMALALVHQSRGLQIFHLRSGPIEECLKAPHVVVNNSPASSEK